jgi:AraC-like DNA-binding protein
MEHEEQTLEGKGYQLHKVHIQLDQIGLKWGTYSNGEELVFRIQPKKASIVSHYRLMEETEDEYFRERQFVVYREPDTAYDIKLTPTKQKPRKFFELSLNEDFFHELGTADSRFLDRFHNQRDGVDLKHYEFIAGMTAHMQEVINDMQRAPFAGRLQEIWLESKAMELFLLQVKQFDRERPANKPPLSAVDLERLHFIREEMQSNWDMPWSIATLARKAGINQQKLKTGFPALFGMTVFEFLVDIRMREAKRMLQDEKLYVGEVAERLGYKHPHHFTAAFRKKFKVLPGDLRK